MMNEFLIVLSIIANVILVVSYHHKFKVLESDKKSLLENLEDSKMELEKVIKPLNEAHQSIANELLLQKSQVQELSNQQISILRSRIKS